MTTRYDARTQIQYSEEPCEYIDEETGEVRSGRIIKKKIYGKPSFVKVCAELLASALDGLDGRCCVMALRIAHAACRRGNIYDATYNEMRQQFGLSENTVTRIIVDLQKRDVIRRVRNGRWMFNPRFGVGCSEEEKIELLEKYFSLTPFVDRKKGEGNYENRHADRSVGAVEAGSDTDVCNISCEPGRPSVFEDVQADVEGLECERADDSEDA